MAQIYRESALVLGRELLADGVFSLRLQTERIAAECAPGQFVSVYCADSSRLLPRPISVCEADPEKGILRLVFRVAGKGTKEFSGLEKGDKLTLTGPLGNGFPLEKLAGRKVLLAGGGIGIPPMLQLAKALSGGENQASELTAAAGFRLAEPVVKSLVQALSGIGGCEIDNACRSPCCFRHCPRSKIIHCDRSGDMQVKMRMRVNKTRKYQLSGGIYKLAAFRRINRRSNPADFFPVNQKIRFQALFRVHQNPIPDQFHPNHLARSFLLHDFNLRRRGRCRQRILLCSV